MKSPNLNPIDSCRLLRWEEAILDSILTLMMSGWNSLQTLAVVAY